MGNVCEEQKPPATFALMLCAIWCTQADLGLILAIKGNRTSLALQLIKRGASLVAVTDVRGRRSLISHGTRALTQS